MILLDGSFWKDERMKNTAIEMAETNYEHELERAEEALTRLATNWRADEDVRTAVQDALNNAYVPGISPEAWAMAAHRAVWGLISSE